MSASVNSRTGRLSFSPFHCGMSNSGRTSIVNSNVIGPSLGTSTASRSKFGSLIAVNRCSSLICSRLSSSSALFDLSETSSWKRFSTTFRGARPMRKPGTAAVGIISPNASSK